MITFRAFTAADASFCFRVRCRAFVLQVARELSPVEIAAGICALVPEDFVQMAEKTDFFMAEETGRAVGFAHSGSVELQFPGLSVRAVRLTKGERIAYR